MSSEPPRVTVTQPTPQTEPAQLNMTSSSDTAQTHEEDGSIFKRSMHVVSDLFSPFSSTALASLPRNPVGFRARSTRIDRIPDSGATDGVPNYRSVEAGGSSRAESEFEYLRKSLLLSSVAVMVYGYVIYQRRITRIRKRDPGHFDQIVGPVLICAALFFAVLANFIIRIREWQVTFILPTETY
ncbi:hypothetical protein RHS01_06218 [Rhizoctonia solani]|uniref:DUF202 domain-containing protein n=1 Tax=Rhizoctonia solani TaxID=456999 RepID=A0A8H7IF63_9AGAM|nr:hypothetical protein RHS01_06218 [Rhizoctonia solani]